MNQPNYIPYADSEMTYQDRSNVIAPQFPQQLQVPTAAGAPIQMQPGFQQFPQYPTGSMGGFPQGPMGGFPVGGMLPLEQSYIENILRLNLGKMATVYMTYEYNPEWNAKVYKGILDEAGRDHIVIRDPNSGKSYLLLMVNLDYVEFDEPITYISPQLPGFVQTGGR